MLFVAVAEAWMVIVTHLFTDIEIRGGHRQN